MDLRVITVQGKVFDYEDVVDIYYENDTVVFKFESGNVLTYFKQHVVAFETMGE